MKLKIDINIFWIFITLLSLSSCVDRIEEEVPSINPKYVIDGTFGTREGIQIIKVSESVPRNSQLFKPVQNASVKVVSKTGESILFSENPGFPGQYEVESYAEAGKEYKMEVILPDNSMVTSDFQKVPQTFELDTIVTIDSLLEFQNDDGKRVRRWVIDIFAQSNVPALDSSLFIRYDFESVWQLSEFPCSPFGPPKLCYVRDQNIAFDITLLELSASDQARFLNQFIYRRLVDVAFGEVLAIKIDALSYNPKEYEYWKQVQFIFNQSGSITDILPARLESNLKSTGSEEVFGNFAVVGQSEKVIFLRNVDVQRDVNPFCGAAGLPPSPLPTPCCNCLAQEGATVAKPYFWPF